MNRADYNVTELPDRILVGRRTETGVREVRIDCTAWLDAWPGLKLSLWVTPPQGAAYAPRTHRVGTSLVWQITDTDTAHQGCGTVEVVGEAAGVRKLSDIVTYQIWRGGVHLEK